MQPKAKVIKSATVAPKAPIKEAAPEIQKLSPEKEIEAIENDQRLNDLLEQMDTDAPLTKEDQKWADKQMQRHQELMKELGWVDDEGEEDLLQQFEDASSALDEFR